MAKLVAVCPPNCSLNESVIGAYRMRLIITLRENGGGAKTMARRLGESLKRAVSVSTMERHIAHLRESNEPDDEALEGPVIRTVTDVQILDAIIVSGERNSKNWKPTIRDVLEAMKLKSQMTGNSAFDSMLQAMEAGLRVSEGSDEDGPMPENPEALGDEEERPADGG